MKRMARNDTLSAVDGGVRKVVAKALTEHKKAGLPITVWKNGKVVEIPAKKIKVSKV